jgi:ubiquinone/menaquinone biosynthesis C-methylase UbiE
MTSPDHPPVCDYEGSDYQTSFWEKGGREYEDRAEAIALRRLLPEQGRRLLELGAGAGRNTPRYQGYERIVLLDYSRTQLRQAQERLGRGPRYMYVAANIYQLPFVDGLFDGTTMIRTLHHMADAPRALNEVRRVLEPQAAFILEYANKHNLKSILRYALRRQAWSPFTHEPVEFVDLNFDFHPQAIRSWLKAAGFAIQRQLTVSHFRIGLVKRIFPAGLLAGMDAAAQLTGDLWQLSPSVFVKAEAVGEPAAAVQPTDEIAAWQNGDFFRCPECGQAPLQVEAAGWKCQSCGRLWLNRDGIYDFREPA